MAVPFERILQAWYAHTSSPCAFTLPFASSAASMGAVAQGGSSRALGVPVEDIAFPEDGELANSALLELVRFDDGMGIPEHVGVN
jgi:hypothetical protein